MKPMLACSTQPDIELIRYPKYASTKLDGIRCLIVNGVALSRSLKPIPNLHIQRTLSQYMLDGLDGELMVAGDFNSVQSAVMSVHGKPEFKYLVFDYVDTSLVFNDRLTQAIGIVYRSKAPMVSVLNQMIVHNPKDVAAMYEVALANGDEGLILKDINSLYKYGRSTLKQETMLKLKDVVLDCEAVVIGFAELMHNENDPTIDKVGNQVRSDHKAFMEAGDTLGALVCTMDGKVFNIGSGFTMAQRSYIWNNKETIRRELVKFKHLGLSKYGVPRCPIFLTFRDKRDL
jgi:DNA ligase-1